MRAALRKALWRSLCIQGAWNYQGMQHAGMLWAQLPLLPQDPQLRRDALRRANEFYNGHPYYCGYLLGAAETMEREGQGPVLSRLKRAAISPLGAGGDRIFWAALKPLAGALSVLVLLPLLTGGPDWLRGLPLLAFGVYNLLHWRTRCHTLEEGARLGQGVYAAIREQSERRALRRLPRALAFVAGLGAPLLLMLALKSSGTQAWTLPAIILLFVLSWQMPRARWALPLLVVILLVIHLVDGGL